MTSQIRGGEFLSCTSIRLAPPPPLILPPPLAVSGLGGRVGTRALSIARRRAEKKGQGDTACTRSTLAPEASPSPSLPQPRSACPSTRVPQDDKRPIDAADNNRIKAILGGR